MLTLIWLPPVLIGSLVPMAGGAEAPGSEWIRLYDWRGGYDWSYAMTLSPDGRSIFLTGAGSPAWDGAEDFLTAAFDSDAGRTLWASSFGTGLESYDNARAIAVDSGGARVYVGGSANITLDSRLVTIAYDAPTGSELWRTSLDTGRFSSDYLDDLVVDPLGSRVFVVGTASDGLGGPDGMKTVAYDAATGEVIWTAYEKGASPTNDYGSAIAVSPDGQRVYMTGWLGTSSRGIDYATHAYDAATGNRLWRARYDGDGHDDTSTDVLASPDGKIVYVTGGSEEGAELHPSLVTIAYRAETGDPIAVTSYSGGKVGGDPSTPILHLSPDASTIYVVGETESFDAVTLSYDRKLRTLHWAATYDGGDGSHDHPIGLAVNPDGSEVYVNGFGQSDVGRNDVISLFYDALTGELNRQARYDGSFNNDDYGVGVAVEPGGLQVYIGGHSDGDFLIGTYPA